MIPAAFFLFGVVVGMVTLALCLVWDREATGREPLGVRHDRLDAEARAATTAPDFDANLKAKWLG